MKYNIDLLTKIINFIVAHKDEPELYLKLNDGTLIEFTCYEDFIDVWINEDFDNLIRFKSIPDFLNNLKINNLSLHMLWNEVKEIYDDLDAIDFTKEPEEQFLVIDGHICYTPEH